MIKLKITVAKALLAAALLFSGFAASAGDYEMKTYTGSDGSVLLYRQHK